MYNRALVQFLAKSRSKQLQANAYIKIIVFSPKLHLLWHRSSDSYTFPNPGKWMVLATYRSTLRKSDENMMSILGLALGPVRLGLYPIGSFTTTWPFLPALWLHQVDWLMPISAGEIWLESTILQYQFKETSNIQNDLSAWPCGLSAKGAISKWCFRETDRRKMGEGVQS